MKISRKISLLLWSCIAAMLLCACGGTESVLSVSGADAEDSASAVSAEAGSAESSAEESSAEEDSTVEEPDADELFYEFTQTATGTPVKLQIYNRKGFPVKNGTVTLQRLEESQDSSGEATLTDREKLEIDKSGFAFLDLQPGESYVLTVKDADGEPAGSCTLALETGTETAGTTEENGGISMTAGTAVDAAITATDDDGEEAGFTLSRIGAWTQGEE